MSVATNHNLDNAILGAFVMRLGETREQLLRVVATDFCDARNREIFEALSVWNGDDIEELLSDLRQRGFEDFVHLARLFSIRTPIERVPGLVDRLILRRPR